MSQYTIKESISQIGINKIILRYVFNKISSQISWQKWTGKSVLDWKKWGTIWYTDKCKTGGPATCNCFWFSLYVSTLCSWRCCPNFHCISAEGWWCGSSTILCPVLF
jgi:hypothetical protein